MRKIWSKYYKYILIAVVPFFFVLYAVFHVNKVESVITKLYDASESIEFAKTDFMSTNDQAVVITDVKTSEKVISLNFKGLADNITDIQVLDILKDYNMKVEFFLPGILAAEDASMVQRISQDGHKIGSNSLSGKLNMDKYSIKELIEDFSNTNTILSSILGSEPESLMLNNTELTQNVLKAAYVCGNSEVIESTHFINHQSFKNYDEVLGYVKKLKNGSILTIKMDGVLEGNEYEPFEKNAKPAVDKKPGIHTGEPVSNNAEITQIVEWVLQALKEQGYTTVFAKDLALYRNEEIDNKSTKPIENSNTKLTFVNKPIQQIKPITMNETLKQLRLENNGKKASQFRTVYTTQPALSYTFYGISRTDVLEDVINKLDILGSKATFYVSEKDVKTNAKQIKKISDMGHEIGISLSELTGSDYYSVGNSILTIKNGVKKITGQDPSLVRYAYDMDITDEALEAISSLGCKIYWQDLSIASSKLGKKATLTEVISNAFNAGNISVRRGYIIYYRMDYYDDPSLIGEAMLTIAKNRINTISYQDGLSGNDSSYVIMPLGRLLMSDKVYNYPLNPEKIIASLKDKIHEGYLTDFDEYEKFDLFKRNYIGNPSLISAKTLPGFSPSEITQLNNTGRFTNDKTLFLTFDDWGSDRSVNQILYVLRKYGIKASFYVRTQQVQNNPNLLRAIAEDGHDVGSHTDKHLVYATTANIEKEDDTYGTYFSLTPEEMEERKNDLLISYNKLQYAIGDIQVGNQPALTTIFRAPTLAISKSGMEAIFDMGFTHILSGDFSTHDYEENDASVLANKIINGIESNIATRNLSNGSVLVMHMSDNNTSLTTKSTVTAATLDIIIPKLMEAGYSFDKISNYLINSH